MIAFSAYATRDYAYYIIYLLRYIEDCSMSYCASISGAAAAFRFAEFKKTVDKSIKRTHSARRSVISSQRKAHVENQRLGYRPFKSRLPLRSHDYRCESMYRYR